MTDIDHRNFYFPEDQPWIIVYEGGIPLREADNRVYHKPCEVLNDQPAEVSTYEYPEEPGVPANDNEEASEAGATLRRK